MKNNDQNKLILSLRSGLSRTRSDMLDQRLRAWADEYAGGKYEDVGYPHASPLASLMRYHGPAPQGLHPRSIIDTESDEVEAAVRALESSDGGYRAGRVLRAEYWMPGAAEVSRLQALERAGLRMSRATYYQQLAVARAHVAGWLRLSSNN